MQVGTHHKVNIAATVVGLGKFIDGVVRIIDAGGPAGSQNDNALLGIKVGTAPYGVGFEKWKARLVAGGAQLEFHLVDVRRVLGLDLIRAQRLGACARNETRNASV